MFIFSVFFSCSFGCIISKDLLTPPISEVKPIHILYVAFLFQVEVEPKLIKVKVHKKCLFIYVTLSQHILPQMTKVHTNAKSLHLNLLTNYNIKHL